MNENWFRHPLQPSPHDWTVEQVEQAATWLLERIPKEVPNPWEQAAQKAIPFLDARRDACLAAIGKNNQSKEIFRRIEKEIAEQNDNPQIALPFKRAVCKIVAQKQGRYERALPVYKKFLRLRPRMFELYVDRVSAGTDKTGKVIEYMLPERSEENLNKYVQSYLDSHHKGLLAGEEIFLQRRQFIEVEAEICSTTQSANARKRGKKKVLV